MFRTKSENPPFFGKLEDLLSLVSKANELIKNLVRVKIPRFETFFEAILYSLIPKRITVDRHGGRDEEEPYMKASSDNAIFTTESPGIKTLLKLIHLLAHLGFLVRHSGVMLSWFNVFHPADTVKLSTPETTASTRHLEGWPGSKINLEDYHANYPEPSPYYRGF